MGTGSGVWMRASWTARKALQIAASTLVATCTRRRGTSGEHGRRECRYTEHDHQRAVGDQLRQGQPEADRHRARDVRERARDVL